jgi:hypothetical protein
MGLSLTPATDMQSRIRTGLLSRGMAPHIADAFIMNFKDESGLNPGINEIAPTVPGSRGGFGLYQLTGPRRVAYEQFAKERGANPADVDAQLDFMMMELQGPESRAAKSIFAAPDAGSAAAAIVTNFLRPAEQHRNSRVAKYQGGGPQSQPQGLMETFSTRSSPQTEAPMQPENATGLLGSLFPNMTADRQDRLAMGLSGLSMFPNQGVMQGAQQRMGERREDRKEAKGQASAQQQANRTLEVLRQAGVSEQDLQIAAGSPEYLRALIGQVAQTRLAGPTKPNWSWNSDLGQYVDMNDPTNTYQPANSGNVSALDKDQMSTLNALSDDATRDLKTSEEMRSSYQRIQSFAGGQAVSDVALVTAFAKLLDPGSVVREGEAAAISQSGSLSEAFKQSMLNALTGQGQLPPEVKQEIVSLSRSLYYDTAQDARHTIQGYQDRASRGGLGGETVYLGSDFTSPAQPQSSLRPQSRGQGQQRPDASPQSSSAGSAPSEIQLRSAISQLSAYDQQLLGSIPTARGQIDFLRSKGLLP